jgi:hypothetical protein
MLGRKEDQAPAVLAASPMAFGALLNLHFRIEPMDLDFSSFDAVVLCTPIWARRPTCPTRTFLRDARLEGKRFACMSWKLARRTNKRKPKESLRLNG